MSPLPTEKLLTLLIILSIFKLITAAKVHKKNRIPNIFRGIFTENWKIYHFLNTSLTLFVIISRLVVFVAPSGIHSPNHDIL